MKDLMFFEGNKVEVFELNGVVYFNPYHVGECLGINTITVRRHIQDMNENQVVNIKNSDVQKMNIRKLNNRGENFLTEKGVYFLVFRSKKEEALRFQDWVTDEVLPSIRQTGGYSIINITEEDKKWLELKRAEQDGNAQYLINYYRRKDKEQFEQILIHERDGEDKRATLEEIANVLSKELGIKVASNDITDFLTYKGYFRLQYFQSMSGGKLRYYGDGSPRMESRPHKQPTGNFIQDLCKQGYAVNKKPDSRGKVTVVYFKGFTKWFLDGHSKEFSKYMRYNKKGFEVWEE